MNTYSVPFLTIWVSIASLVVPAISETITLSSPRSLFMIEDLPTLGLPIMAILGLSSSVSSLALSGKYLTTSSSISPIPSLEAPDTG